jgi:DNA-binding NarL/FixJ family response regulator
MEELRRGIHEILEGRRYVCSELTEKRKRNNAPGMRRLSGRQTEVLRLIAQGLSGTRIAEELGVSPKTVDYHRAEIRRALGLCTTAELVRYAVSAGMVPPEVRIPS